MLGSKDLTDKKAGIGVRVVWYKETPAVGLLPAGSPDISAPKQAELVDLRTPQIKRHVWELDRMV